MAGMRFGDGEREAQLMEPMRHNVTQPDERVLYDAHLVLFAVFSTVRCTVVV
jgi:hypothetical protein